MSTPEDSDKIGAIQAVIGVICDCYMEEPRGSYPEAATEALPVMIVLEGALAQQAELRPEGGKTPERGRLPHGWDRKV